ncbi:ABC transporter substrate-binding protein [Inquilinus limosus]|uniref:Peptide ABC transporter n=1 Tax=Inquilinus limosus TaxID=171674 RepID=A0A211ZTH0_9PROT|nr:ABC transporter substrate-binding protein [Inquilinus limosus]OWJ68504.1 peptide ABC transporter [Inquilinus limosus]
MAHPLKPALLGAALAFALALPATAEAKDRFVVDLVNEPSTLDPQLQWNPDSYYVYRNIFDNLVTRDDKGGIVPQIATEWKTLSDTRVEFEIRDGVTFHDGSTLTPEDVAFSVNRIIDPKLASPQQGQFDKIVKAEATGQHSVVLTLAGPYPALLAQLVKLSIVPKHVVEAVGNDAFNLKPVGSGPYKFDGWQRGVAVTLTRNDAYWGTKGPFATAVFRAVPDAATRLADVEAGSADLAVSLDSDLAGQLEASGKGKRLYTLTERLAYLRLNPTKPPFDDKRLRQAVAYAVDKEGITQGILGGLDKPIGQMVTPAHFGWFEDIPGLPFDPDKAKALVAEVGGSPKVEIATGAFFDQRVVQAIQQELADVGFDASINLVDTPTFLKLIQQGAQGGPTLAVSRSSCACQDADGALYQLFHSGNPWTIVENKEVDGWLDDARSTLDSDRRLTDYRKVSTFIATELPVVPLFQTVAIYGAAKPLQWTPTPNESLFLNRMSWSE